MVPGMLLRTLQIHSLEQYHWDDSTERCEETRTNGFPVTLSLLLTETGVSIATIPCKRLASSQVLPEAISYCIIKTFATHISLQTWTTTCGFDQTLLKKCSHFGRGGWLISSQTESSADRGEVLALLRNVVCSKAARSANSPSTVRPGSVGDCGQNSLLPKSAPVKWNSCGFATYL